MSVVDNFKRTESAITTSGNSRNLRPGAIPRVLTIAGTDPTGGAGLQADIKSITAAGGFALAVTTAIVSQNTRGVSSVFTPETQVIKDELAAVSDDVAIDAVKIGMLGNVDYIRAVRAWLEEEQPPIVVIDPVMVATSGDHLLDPDAASELRELLPLATVITPNIPELEVLAQMPAGSIKDDHAAIVVAQQLAAEMNLLVTVKAGHLSDPVIHDALVDASGVVAQVDTPRIDTATTHGTGCSMSSALATRLAAGDTPAQALRWVANWLNESIAAGEQLQVGSGHGPIDHSHRARRLAAAASARPWEHQTLPVEEFIAAVLEGDTNSAYSAIPAPHVAPAGRWTQALWTLAQPIMQQIRELPFIQQLANGTLSLRDFTAYQRQDALYLKVYARTLLLLAAHSHSEDEGAQWAADGTGAIQEEQLMHHRWLSEHEGNPDLVDVMNLPATPITEGYTNFLLANVAADDYAVGVLAVLPCYWLYTELGLELAAKNTPTHPFHDWLSTYGDPGFLQATRNAIAIAERVLNEAAPDVCERAIRAFTGACLWEREFFDQAQRIDV